jgi:hypothetical protein
MKSSTVCSLLVGAVVFAAATVNATISDKVTINGVMTWQTANTTSASGVVTFHTKSAAFNSKTLFALLNASSAFTNATGGVTIPAGSWLSYDGSSVWATNKNGSSFNLSSLLDSSETPVPFVTTSFGATQVTTGHLANDPTLGGGSEDISDATFSATLQDGNGTSVTINGLGSEHFTRSKSNAAGNAKQSQSFKGSGGGAAVHQGNTSAISRGTISGSGKGVVSTLL